MKMVQCLLSQGNDRMTSWIDYDKRLRIGIHVTLKGLNGRWRIETMSEPSHNSINRGWNVGGL